MAKPIIKGFLCQYKVSITTGNCNGASTSAPIRIKFYGSKGCTDFHELMESETHRVPFVKDQTDVFTVQTYHVGELIGITIGHNRLDMRTFTGHRSKRSDQSSFALGSSWYLSNVTIVDLVTDTTYEIACNAWLSIKSPDQKTMRDCPVTSAGSKKHKNEGDGKTRLNVISDRRVDTFFRTCRRQPKPIGLFDDCHRRNCHSEQEP